MAITTTMPAAQTGVPITVERENACAAASKLGEHRIAREDDDTIFTFLSGAFGPGTYTVRAAVYPQRMAPARVFVVEPSPLRVAPPPVPAPPKYAPGVRVRVRGARAIVHDCVPSSAGYTYRVQFTDDKMFWYDERELSPAEHENPSTLGRPLPVQRATQVDRGRIGSSFGNLHPFKVGDVVRTNAAYRAGGCEAWLLVPSLTVRRVDRTHVYVDGHPDGAVAPKWLELVPAGPKCPFKVGDRVRATAQHLKMFKGGDRYDARTNGLQKGLPIWELRSSDRTDVDHTVAVFRLANGEEIALDPGWVELAPLENPFKAGDRVRALRRTDLEDVLTIDRVDGHFCWVKTARDLAGPYDTGDRLVRAEDLERAGDPVPLAPPAPNATCLRCGGPAWIGLHTPECMRTGGCKTVDERVGEPDSVGTTSGFVPRQRERTLEEKMRGFAGDISARADDLKRRTEPYFAATGAREGRTIAVAHPTRDGAIAAWKLAARKVLGE